MVQEDVVITLAPGASQASEEALKAAMPTLFETTALRAAFLEHVRDAREWLVARLAPLAVEGEALDGTRERTLHARLEQFFEPLAAFTTDEEIAWRVVDDVPAATKLEGADSRRRAAGQGSLRAREVRLVLCPRRPRDLLRVLGETERRWARVVASVDRLEALRTSAVPLARKKARLEAHLRDDEAARARLDQEHDVWLHPHLDDPKPPSAPSARERKAWALDARIASGRDKIADLERRLGALRVEAACHVETALAVVDAPDSDRESTAMAGGDCVEAAKTALGIALRSLLEEQRSARYIAHDARLEARSRDGERARWVSAPAWVVLLGAAVALGVELTVGLLLRLDGGRAPVAEREGSGLEITAVLPHPDGDRRLDAYKKQILEHPFLRRYLSLDAGDRIARASTVAEVQAAYDDGAGGLNKVHGQGNWPISTPPLGDLDRVLAAVRSILVITLRAGDHVQVTLHPRAQAALVRGYGAEVQPVVGVTGPRGELVARQSLPAELSRRELCSQEARRMTLTVAVTLPPGLADGLKSIAMTTPLAREAIVRPAKLCE